MGWLPLITALLLITAHRLPAPIQEIPESATPARTEQAKPRKAQSKSKAGESEVRSKFTQKPSAPKLQGPARFAGIWTGTINQGMLGTPQVKIVVNSNATLVTHSSNLSGEMGTHAATINGDTLRWHTGWGWANGLTWTLTPKADGQTAVTTSKSLVAAHGPATFSKRQTGE